MKKQIEERDTEIRLLNREKDQIQDKLIDGKLDSYKIKTELQATISSLQDKIKKLED